MSAFAWRTRLLVVSVAFVVGAVVLLDGRGTSRSLAQDKDKKADTKPEKKKADKPEKPERPDEDKGGGNPLETAQFLGVATCKACHTQPTANYRESLDFVLLTEYTTWRSLDKHSQAYAVLEGPRGKRMGELLAGDAAFVTKPESGCLGCHSMNYAKERQGENFSIKDGVSCDGCHGPSEKWLTEHYTKKKTWRMHTPQYKEEHYGMRDVRDPVKRSELCMSCHVGKATEGKVVTHTMYAAGHPPLPNFEVGSFCKNLPQHWRDPKDVPFFKETPEGYDKEKVQQNYHFQWAPTSQTRLALAGNLVALPHAVELLAQRSDISAKKDAAARWPELALPNFDASKNPEQRWPEVAMTHCDCYACHHELVLPSWRQQRGYSFRLMDGKVLAGVPGRPHLRPWPIPVFEFSIQQAEQSAATDFRAKFEELHKAFNAQPFGKPGDIHTSAGALAQWAQGKAEKVRDAKLDPQAALQMLRNLASFPQADFVDFDTARQITATLAVVYGEWDPDHKHAEIPKLLARLDKDLVLSPNTGRVNRLALFRKEMVDKGAKDVPPADDLLKLLEKAADQNFQTSLSKDERAKLQGYIDALDRTVSDKDLVNVLLSATFLNEIGKIGNEELEKFLDRASKYNPAEFKKTLEEISAQLPGK